MKVNCSCDLSSGEIGLREAFIDIRQFGARTDVVYIDIYGDKALDNMYITIL